MEKAFYHSAGLMVLVGILFGVTGAQGTSDLGKNLTKKECPTWFVRNGTSQECTCGPGLDGVTRCNQATKEVWLDLHFCMTYDSETGNTLVGECPFNALQRSDYDSNYALLPKELIFVNTSFCGKANREGMLCSQCKPGYGPPMFLYTVKCTECSQSRYSWLLFLLLACVPTTIFFFIIVFCQVRTTSAPLNGFITGCQILSISLKLYPQFLYSASEAAMFFLHTTSSLLSLWNLDFFPFVTPPFCVGEHLSNLQVLCIEYIGAFFPLLLITITYVCIQQHARGCKLLVLLWKPFGYCLAPLVKRFGWNPAESMVHAFSSFLILSSTKILFVSFSLLKTIRLYANIHSKRSYDSYLLFYDASVVFFSKEHLLYAFLAIAVSAVFVVMPCIVLTLYPTRLFQKCLNRCGIRWPALHIFADAFNGCYKDGTDGTRDYRCFAGFYLFIRISFLLVELTPYTEYNAVRSVLAITALLIFALSSPYKARVFNILDSLWLALSAYAFISGSQSYTKVMYAVLVLSLVAYFIAYLTCQVVFKVKFPWCQNLKAFAERVTGEHTQRSLQVSDCEYDLEESFPHRAMNPGEYTATADKDEAQHLIIESTNDVFPTYGVAE